MWRTSTGPGVRVRRVRAAGHSPDRRGVLGAAVASPAAARELLHGVRHHGCYSVGDDELWGVVRRRKSAANTLAALKTIRARRPDGGWHVILDNLSAHKGTDIARWAKRNNVELCFTRPTAHASKRTSGRCASSCSTTPGSARPPAWRNANKRSPELLDGAGRAKARKRGHSTSWLPSRGERSWIRVPTGPPWWRGTVANANSLIRRHSWVR